MNLRATLSLVCALALGAGSAANAAVTPTTSPLAPINRNCREAEDQPISVHKKTARIARVAICTEDISQIKFSEYYVDWSAWMNEVGNRWSTVFNAAYNTGKFRTNGPAFIQFTCKQDGTITAIGLSRSSGDMLCDRSQIEALANCMPLPSFPVGSQKKTITVLYVWEYGGQKPVAQKATARHATQQLRDGERITISGKIM